MTGREHRRFVASLALALLAGGGACAEGVTDGERASEGAHADERSGAGDVGAPVDLRFGRPGVAPSCEGPPVDRETAAARAKAFSTAHGVETLIAFDACWEQPHVTCRAVPPSEYAGVVAFLDHVDSELAIYPADFFRTIHLDLVVFAGALARDGVEQDTAVGGAVVPHGDGRSLLYLSSAQTRFCDAAINRRMLHHEIAHAIDSGLTFVSETGWWSTLNPAGFTYGDVRADLSASALLAFEHPAAGFVSTYARASVKEDYAEVYAALFAPEVADRLRGWLLEDRWLRAKVDSVVRALAARWPAFVAAMPNAAAFR